MNAYWQNLRPLEKRLVVAVGSALFILLNFWFVVPHFSDLSKTDARIAKANKTLAIYETEIARMPMYKSNISILQGEGLSVPQEEQAFNFFSSVNSQAAQSGIQISSTGKIRYETNQFFLELSQNITVQSKEEPLVDFLYNLGSGTSLIRVRDLGLHPDPPHHTLMASIRLVASYQRKPSAKSTASSSTASTAKPPAAAAPKTTTETPKAPLKAPSKSPEPVKTGTNAASPSTKKIMPPNKKTP